MHTVRPLVGLLAYNVSCVILIFSFGDYAICLLRRSHEANIGGVILSM